jgi:peptidyl-prolyl cis-trans isomerase SurA
MRSCARTGKRRLCSAAVLGLAFAGCTSGTPVVRDAARPQADAILADPTPLLPQVPIASTTATRGQKPEVQPVNIIANNSPGVQPATASTGQVAVRLRAMVNQTPILDDEVREAMAQYVGELLQMPEAMRPQKQQQIYERELQRLIERELVLAEAQRRLDEVKKPQIMEDLKKEAAKEADKQLLEIKKRVGAKSDAEFKAMLEAQGLSEGGMRRQFERNFMMIEYVRNIIYPKAKDISLGHVRDYYERHPQEFTTADRVTWQDIFIDVSRFQTPAQARQYAEAVLMQARSGQEFTGLVKQHDQGDSRLRNGKGLGEKHGEIAPNQVEPIVWSLKVGEVGPLVDLGFGFHIVRIAEREYSGLRPLDEKCQKEIRAKLTNLIADREYKQMVDDLKKKATVTIYQ